jgi:hypothetical protein
VCPINMKETLSSFFPLDNENITKWMVLMVMRNITIDNTIYFNIL